MENNGVRYKVGDYVEYRVAEDRFRGVILDLVKGSKGGPPTEAVIEVSVTTKKSAEVNVSVMTVKIGKLSPLL